MYKSNGEIEAAKRIQPRSKLQQYQSGSPLLSNLHSAAMISGHNARVPRRGANSSATNKFQNGANYASSKVIGSSDLNNVSNPSSGLAGAYG